MQQMQQQYQIGKPQSFGGQQQQSSSSAPQKDKDLYGKDPAGKDFSKDYSKDFGSKDYGKDFGKPSPNSYNQRSGSTSGPPSNQGKSNNTGNANNAAVNSLGAQVAQQLNKLNLSFVGQPMQNAGKIRFLI